jgi:hypothetical protein
MTDEARRRAEECVTEHPEQPGVAGSTDNQGGCGFHEYLELDGYTGPEFPPRPA